MIEPRDNTRMGRILVIDDYADERAGVREALETAGHTVAEAADGQEALHILAESAPRAIDLIVLDLQMPKMDGWQFLRLLKNYVGLRHIPVVVVSAYAESIDAKSHPSVVAVLARPYEARQLLSVIDACLLH